MTEYRPPFTITNEILSNVSSISEKIGCITAISSLEAKPHLRKNNRIKSIHSSLKIEANSLTLGQVRDVINGKTVLGEKKEIQEVKNAYTAYEQPVFRRSTRKFPSFSSCHFFISFPASRFFLYLQQIFNALLGLFLLKKFF